MQNITLTRKQFIALLKAVYIGSWVANAFKVTDYRKSYEDIASVLFSFAPQFGVPEYVDYKKEDGHFPTTLFEDTSDVHEVISDYNNEVFWDELAHRMGELAFERRYTEKEREAMTDEEHFAKFHACVDEFLEEFENFGLDRVSIAPPSTPKKKRVN